ncbi:MAG TPA: hypothetical protein V6D26_24665 [Stenomitos sp.]
MVDVQLEPDTMVLSILSVLAVRADGLGKISFCRRLACLQVGDR